MIFHLLIFGFTVLFLIGVIMKRKSAVWHVKEWGVFESRRWPEDYECVAYVKSSNVEDCFRLTNTIDAPWYDNPEVECLKKTRSTSVGDVIVTPDHKIHLCMPMGWQELDDVSQELDPWKLFKPAVP